MLERKDAVSWLQKFGYLAKELVPDNLEFDSALKKMQARYKLKQDGFLGPITSKAMGLFRCAVPDVLRVTLDGSTDCKWQKSSLTYFLSPNFRLHGHTVKESADMIDQAASLWTQHIPLKITRTDLQAKADVRIGVGRGRKDGFDGVGNTLAWAYMPCLEIDAGLNMMFDQDEPWTKNLREAAGVYALAVGVHEWGHILGLDHSDDESNVMASFYNPQIWTPQAGDIGRVTGIYGAKTAGRITVSVSGTMTTNPGGQVLLDLSQLN
jgi:hypothetical protein